MLQCPKCGAQAPDGARQCAICFADLSAGAAAVPPAPASGGIPDAPVAATPLGAPLGGESTPAPLGGGMVPREEDYMPVPGIPGVDNIPKDAPPAYGAPAPPAPIGLGGGAPRMTLGGDVIQEQPPHNYGQPIGGAPMGPSTMRPVAPTPLPARRGSTRMRSASAEAKPSGGSPVAVVLVILLLLVGGGGFGYWYWQQQAPKRVAGEFMEAFKKKDWKTFYSMIELPAEQKAQVNEEQFVMAMGFVGNMISLKKYEIGDMSMEGDTAKVKVTTTVSTTMNLPNMPAGDKTSTADIPFKKYNGKWKLDASSARGGMPGLGGMGSMGGGMPGQ